MISKVVANKEFRIAKNHSIHYASHSYSNINIKHNIFKDILFEQNVWDNKIFREKYIKWCFEDINIKSEIECFNFIKGKLENKIYLNENLKSEIKSAKLVLNLEDKSKTTILEDLLEIEEYDG